jgi:MoxR-like ATPase
MLEEIGAAYPAPAIAAQLGRVREGIERVIIGKSGVIDLLLVALLCEGHVLLEDVPGLGKTMLAKSLARTLDCSFRRLQFTPDLLPSDITGVAVYNQKQADFEFRPGPVFANVVLADEINRATPRTQAALLEAMEERQVSAEGETRQLPRPFLVLATQNPIELEGTFPLPEAQLDRFLLRVRLGYPSEEEERAIARRFETADPLPSVQSVLDPGELLQLITAARYVHLSDAVLGYAVSLVRATRDNPDVELGASPRATLALTRAARGLAALRGRQYVIPDDVKTLAPAVLAHRLIVAAASQLHGEGAEGIVRACLQSVPVPVEAEGRDG